MREYTRHSVHQFTSMSDATFDPKDYSRLKFGSNDVAKSFGSQLADTFFTTHAQTLLANRIVVIPSPYNHVKNAATIMTEHFVDCLNEKMVQSNGTHIETSIIHRKVSYTNDYGFLTQAQRKGLIDNDQFYMNHDFLHGKLLIFIDDVRITGTHEDKLVEILDRDRVENDAMFLYFAEYFGIKADIEAAINFAGMSDYKDFIEIAKAPGHQMIVRPIKYLLDMSPHHLVKVYETLTDDQLNKFYYGCLAEGYYKIPKYQNNFNGVVAIRKQRNVK